MATARAPHAGGPGPGIGRFAPAALAAVLLAAVSTPASGQVLWVTDAEYLESTTPEKLLRHHLLGALEESGLEVVGRKRDLEPGDTGYEIVIRVIDLGGDRYDAAVAEAPFRLEGVPGAAADEGQVVRGAPRIAYLLHAYRGLPEMAAELAADYVARLEAGELAPPEEPRELP